MLLSVCFSISFADPENLRNVPEFSLGPHQDRLRLRAFLPHLLQPWLETPLDVLAPRISLILQTSLQLGLYPEGQCTCTLPRALWVLGG